MGAGEKVLQGVIRMRDEASRVMLQVRDATSNLGSETVNTTRSQDGLNGTIGKLGGIVAAAFAVDKVIGFGKSVVEETARLNAMDAQFEQIFKGIEGEQALRRIEGAEKDLGIHTDRITESFNKFGAQVKGAGMDSKMAMDATDKATRLAADSAAFYDDSLEDASGSLASFMKGNFEAGDAIGVFTNASQMNQKSMEMYNKQWKDLSEAERQWLLLDTVEKTYELNGAMGQAARESSQYENVMGNLKATWNEFKQVIGQPILEVAIAGIQALGGVIQWATGFVQDCGDKFNQMKTFVSNNESAFRVLISSVLALVSAFALMNLMSFIQQSGGFMAVLRNMALAFNALTLAKIKDGLQTVALNAMYAGDFLRNIGSSIISLATQTGAFIASTAAKVANTFAQIAMTVATVSWNAVCVIATTVTTAFGVAVAFLTSPIGLAILAITALIGIGILLYKNWDTIKAKTTEVWEGIKTKISETWENIKQSFSNGINSIKNFVTQTIPQIVNNIVNWFKELPYKLGEIIGFAIGRVILFGIEIGKIFTQTIPQVINSIVNWFKELPGKIAEQFNLIITNVTTWGINFFTTAVSLAKKVVDGIVFLYVVLPIKIATYFNMIIQNVIAWGIQFVANARTGAINAVNAIVTFMSQLPGQVKAKFNQVVTAAVAWATSFAAKGKEGATKFATRLYDEMKKIPGKVKKFGKDIVDGILNGITNAISGAANAFASFGEGIVNGIKKGLDINSPSGLARDEIGVHIPTGIAVGVAKAIPTAVRMINKSMYKMMAGVDTPETEMAIGVTTSNSGDVSVSKTGGISTDLQSSGSVSNKSKGNIIVNFNLENVVIREEADIDKLGDIFVKKLKLAGIGGVV